MNIIESLIQNPEQVKEENAEAIVNELVVHYENKIQSLCKYVFNNTSDVCVRALTESVKVPMKRGIISFYINKELWKKDRDIEPYLLTVLNRFARDSVDKKKKRNVHLCPGCRFKNKKQYLHLEGSLLRCDECTDMSSNIENEILDKKKLNEDTSILESKLELYKIFSLHSKKGYKCPDCTRFIPETCNGSYGISCPYTDCMFFGSIESLEKMVHPVTQVDRNDISLDASLTENELNLYSLISSNTISSDSQLEIKQQFYKEKDLLKSVIEKLISTVGIYNTNTIFQMKVMYEAYLSMLDDHTEDMISYLVHLNANLDAPIQSRIFQKYVSLVQESLPLDLTISGTNCEILSLLDPRIALFEGISEFTATSRMMAGSIIIPNETIETYTGGISFKDYGPCFIGWVLDVIDKETELSVKDKIIDYTFSHIKINTDIDKVYVVKHYRIPSHYEMGALSYLQKARRKIVDKVSESNG